MPKQTVANPEWDKELAKLRAEQEAAHQAMETASIEWARCRSRLDAAQGDQTLSTPGSEVNTQARKIAREAAEGIDAADKTRREVKAKLCALADTLPRVRQKVARRIAAEVAPANNAAVATYLKSKVQRLADEIVAAEEVRRLTAEASARRVARIGWACIGGPAQDERQHAQLREDVRAALAAGALKPGDLPRGLRETWGL